MILRPLESLSAAAVDFLPAWTIVDRLQRQPYDGCWMITQPSHAALAGEFAAKISVATLPRLDADLVRAIALHDAGWGVPDAQAIMQSRSVSQGCPRSFISCSVGEFLTAWEKSIDIAESAGAAGGYMVSRHFWRLGSNRVDHGNDNAGDRNKLKKFLENESKRQEYLKGRQNHSDTEVERLTDVLQFCDLLSLYVCSGAKENAEFPEYFGTKVQLRVIDEGYKIEPQVIEPGSEFAVAALRHPATKELSGREIQIRIV